MRENLKRRRERKRNRNRRRKTNSRKVEREIEEKENEKQKRSYNTRKEERKEETNKRKKKGEVEKNREREKKKGLIWVGLFNGISGKSDLTDKMKLSFFQAVVVSILLFGCTTWTLSKRLEKKIDGNYKKMLRAILNTSWRQHPTKHQLYGHLPPIMKTIQVRRTRHAGHCWRSRDELISDVLLWTSSNGRAKAGRPARTYIQQLCQDTRWRIGISVLVARHDEDEDGSFNVDI